MKRLKLALAATALLASGPAALAEVTRYSETSFVINHSLQTKADRATTWAALIAPNKWWSASHTYSGDAANLYLDAQATGCFCEKLPKPADAPAGQRIGSVEHMHVVYADPQRGVLRMVGGLGPLQSEPVHGVLTITLRQREGGTRIEWQYVVGGAFSVKPEELAPLVDKVLGEQLDRLGKLLNAPAPEPGPAKAS
jgi:hypothetical protein